MSSFAAITDYRLDALNQDMPSITTYQHRYIYQKCRERLCTSTIGFIHVMFIITMFCSTCIYCALGILYMYNNSITSLCNISHLWIYTLLSTIHASFRSTYILCTKSDNKFTSLDCTGCYNYVLYYAVCFFIIELVLSGWGFVEVYVVPNISNINSTDIDINITNVNKFACSHLRHTDIWNFGVISMFVQFVFTVILFITVFHHWIVLDVTNRYCVMPSVSL